MNAESGSVLESFAAGLTWPESPRWHQGALYLSDCYNFRIVRIFPGTEPVSLAQVPGRPAGLGFMPDGRLLVAGALDRKLWWVLPTGELELAVDLSAETSGNLNDMVVDSQGRAWVGSTGFRLDLKEAEKPGRLHCWVPDAPANLVADQLRFPNGLAVSADGGRLYLNETLAEQITVFDIDDAGALRNRRIHAQLSGMPDGLCLDGKGALWAAMIMQREFVRVAQDGTVLERIGFDKELAVSCVLGGVDRKTLYLGVSEHDLAEPKGMPKGRVVAVSVATGGSGFP